MINHSKLITYPDPLPPTMATFFPAGTVNDKPLSIFCPGTYSKWTSSKVILDFWGLTRSSGAVGSVCNKSLRFINIKVSCMKTFHQCCCFRFVCFLDEYFQKPYNKHYNIFPQNLSFINLDLTSLGFSIHLNLRT